MPGFDGKVPVFEWHAPVFDRQVPVFDRQVPVFDRQVPVLIGKGVSTVSSRWPSLQSVSNYSIKLA